MIEIPWPFCALALLICVGGWWAYAATKEDKRQLDAKIEAFCAALYHYGGQAQITMVFEEMAELQDVLCKFLRGRVDGDTYANIAEELADVGIMLDQMAIEFEVEDAVSEQRASKVQRLRERIENDA